MKREFTSCQFPPVSAKKLYALTEAYGYDLIVLIYCEKTGEKLKFCVKGRENAKIINMHITAAFAVFKRMSLTSFFTIRRYKKKQPITGAKIII